MENNKGLSELLEDWEETGEIDDEAVNEIVENFDELIEEEFGIIKELLERGDEDSSYVALSQMQYLVSVLNIIIPKKPSLIRKFRKGWLRKFKSVLGSISKNIKADSFSISIGFPFGISIGLSFKIP